MPNSQPCRAKQPGLCKIHGGGSFNNLPALREHLKALHPGLQLIATETDNLLDLDLIIIPKTERRSGAGTDTMEHLISYADSRKLPIILTPEDVFGTPKQILVQFYSKFGFNLATSRQRNGKLTTGSMRRPPQ